MEVILTRTNRFSHIGEKAMTSCLVSFSIFIDFLNIKGSLLLDLFHGYLAEFLHPILQGLRRLKVCNSQARSQDFLCSVQILAISGRVYLEIIRKPSLYCLSLFYWIR